ncbi:MAG TPA: DUF2894 domain-containing protein [Noviherbaspirillum sp.]
MNEPACSDMAETPPDASPDVGALIAALRTAGADRFDPVRLHYIDALARRALMHQGSVRRMLDGRLAHALAAFREGFERAQEQAREILARSVQHTPSAADELERRFAAGDFKGLRRLAASLETDQSASLGALVRRLEQHAPEAADARPELRAIRNGRKTWAKLSVDRQVAQALEQAPRNAGPINSHMLVLRSLALMREISPDYLNRFMSYADTLLCLDQGEKEKPVPPKKAPATKAAKKSKG